RQIVAAPERAASEVWDVITGLVVSTLERSQDISGSDVTEVMEIAAPVGRILIAAGHLDKHPVVLVAAPVHLSITTVSGTAAAMVDENLAPVPGGASAAEWTLHLPTPDPMAQIVRQIVAESEHLSAETAPTSVAEKSAGDVTSEVDQDAFARRKPEA